VIVVAEYDPARPQRFSQLRREYATAMAAAGLTEAERASIDANQVPSHEENPR